MTAGPGLLSFKHSRKGYIAVMKSEPVRADLQRRAEAVAAVVRAKVPGSDITADARVGRTRAGGSVFGVPMRVEVESRVLGRAIGSAR
jgi:hypothetical protein